MSSSKMKRQQKLMEEYLREQKLSKPEGLGFVEAFEKVGEIPWQPLAMHDVMQLSIADLLTDRRIMGKVQIEDKIFYFTTYTEDKQNLAKKYPGNPVISLSQLIANWMSELNNPLRVTDVMVLGVFQEAKLIGVKENVDYEPFE